MSTLQSTRVFFSYRKKNWKSQTLVWCGLTHGGSIAICGETFARGLRQEDKGKWWRPWSSRRIMGMKWWWDGLTLARGTQALAMPHRTERQLKENGWQFWFLMITRWNAGQGMNMVQKHVTYLHGRDCSWKDNSFSAGQEMSWFYET